MQMQMKCVRGHTMSAMAGAMQFSRGRHPCHACSVIRWVALSARLDQVCARCWLVPPRHDSARPLMPTTREPRARGTRRPDIDSWLVRGVSNSSFGSGFGPVSFEWAFMRVVSSQHRREPIEDARAGGGWRVWVVDLGHGRARHRAGDARAALPRR